MIFLISKEWDEKFNDNFSEKFPYIEEMWEILANWRVEKKDRFSEESENYRFGKETFSNAVV